MKRRFLTTTAISVVILCTLSVVAWTYGANLSFPAARRFVVTQGYSADHQAYDYGFPNHTQVVAAKAGQVSSSLWTRADGWDSHCTGGPEDRGNYLILDHGGGVTTRYYHLSNTGSTPGSGTSFDRGDYMALSDDTGCSTGPHLHFQLLVGGSARDPYAGTTEWVSGSPIPMGYRDQNNNGHGPYAIDYGSIPSLWLGREGESGAPLDNEIPGAIVGQDASGAALVEWVQPFEHGYISTVTGWYAYAKTYLPDIRADLNESNWNSTIIVRNNSLGWVSCLRVQNTGSGDNTVWRRYYPLEGGDWQKSNSQTIPPGGSREYYAPAEGLPGSFAGSAVLYSGNGQPLGAISNVAGNQGGDFGASFNLPPR
jgi:hypothetical protein